MYLKNKTALVLGAIKGIGLGIGLALLKEGVKTALNYYDWEEHLPAMQKSLASVKTTGEAMIMRTNLLETAMIEPMVKKVIARFGRLDILINNIERGGWPIVHGPYTCEQWDLEIDTTLRAKQWVFEAALPYLQANGAGLVINLSSIAGIVGRAGPATYIFNDGYAAANRGIASLTETWARQAAPQVRVNEIMLGMIATRHGDQTRGWNLLTPEQQKAVLDHTLLQRIGNIDDVVKTVLFIIKDAPFLTGSVIRLDGGYVLGNSSVAPMPAGVI